MKLLFVSPALPTPSRLRRMRPSAKMSAPVVPTPARPTRRINGLSDVITNYSVLLLDQFGVVHDGRTVYPAAHAAMQAAVAQGVRIIILSNSSQRGDNSRRKLSRMGVEPDLVTGFVTSGDLASTHVSAYAEEHPDARALHFNWGSSSYSRVSLREHGLEHIAPLTRTPSGSKDGTTLVPRPEDVDVIIAHGMNALTQPDGTVRDIALQDGLALLREVGATRSHVPFFCANPDIITVDGAELRPMPGTLAREFENAGGVDVRRLGKPDIVAYEAAMKMAGVQKNEILAVGDSVGHDILGAANAGIDSLYIAGGINAEHFGMKTSDGFEDKVDHFEWDADVLDNIVSEEASELGDRRPTFVTPFFRW